MIDHANDKQKLLALADITLMTARLFVSPTRLDLDEFALDAEARERLETALGSGSLAEQLCATVERVHETPSDAWRLEWNRLFEGAVICPINETAYIRRDKGLIVSDICGFYRAFGLEPDATSGEKADHLVSELEFIALLLIMLAHAPDDDARRVTRDALRSFLEEHLGEWLRYFTGRLEECSALAMYGDAAALLRGLWDTLAGRFELPTFQRLDDGPVAVEPELSDTPYECGMAEADQQAFVQLTGPAGTGLPEAE